MPDHTISHWTSASTDQDQSTTRTRSDGMPSIIWRSSVSSESIGMGCRCWCRLLSVVKQLQRFEVRLIADGQLLVHWRDGDTGYVERSG